MGSLKNKLIAFREAKKQYTWMNSKEIIRHITRANKIKHFEYVIYRGVELNDDCIDFVAHYEANAGFYSDAHMVSTYSPVVLVLNGRSNDGARILLSGYCDNDSDYCIMNDVHFDTSNMEFDDVDVSHWGYDYERGMKDSDAFKCALASASYFAEKNADADRDYSEIYRIAYDVNQLKSELGTIQNTLINARVSGGLVNHYRAFCETMDSYADIKSDIAELERELDLYSFYGCYESALNNANNDSFSEMQRFFNHG